MAHGAKGHDAQFMAPMSLVQRSLWAILYVDNMDLLHINMDAVEVIDKVHIAIQSANANLGKYSFINRKRYYQTYTAEPTAQVGYKELCFNIAEAINRGWITGNAETWYQNGIKSSLGFYGIKDGANTVTFQN